MVTAIRVAIVDDHDLACEGARSMLDRDKHIQVIGCAHDRDTLTELVAAKEPDVVLMDIELGPPENGLALAKWLRSKLPRVHIVFLSNYDEDAFVVEAIASGASGYLLKDCSGPLLTHTVHAVVGGMTLFRRDLLDKAMKMTKMGDARSRHMVAQLTPAEREVLIHLAAGEVNKDIADRLIVSESTVKKHVQSILKKAGASNRTEAVAKMAAAGFFNASTG
ncbi:MAG: response regulator transcription factor [Candidatus Nanopelagicales bacterium]|nr:response regulator transcription factor [Candidatus Nanopelagicales bacterium]MDZ4249155.1 response regulator transcription factor [Candidatus Nanopelagicales bacterium]MDZ7577387.1 response regulator transcription factor [Candidatus Nanopelagicales bacterium]